LGATATVVGLSFTLALITQGTVMVRAGRYSDKNGRKPVIVLGFLITFISLFLLAFSTNVTFYIIAMMILGFGAGFATSAGAIIGDVIKGKSGKVYALWQMAGDAGMMVGPILLGIIADSFSYRSAILVSAIIFSLAIVIAIRIPETNSARLGDSVNRQLRAD
jgi:MFS family permease